MTASKSRVQIAMARACMSLDDIARAAQIPKSTVKNVTRGRSVKPATLGKVAAALNVDPADLLPDERSE